MAPVASRNIALLCLMTGPYNRVFGQLLFVWNFLSFILLVLSVLRGGTRGEIPGGVFPGILVGGVPPGSPIPDPISDQTMSLFSPVYRPGCKEIMSWLLRLEQQKKDFLKSITNSHICLSFLFVWNRNVNTFIQSRSCLNSMPNWAKSIPVVTPKRRKTLPFGEAQGRTPGRNAKEAGSKLLLNL